MPEYPSHESSIVALKRVEGQIRGIQKMIGAGKYCVDILHQIQAVVAALASVEDKILEKHLESCVVHAMQGKSALERTKKISEVMRLVKQSRRA